MALQASRNPRTGRVRTIGAGVGLTVAALLLSTIFASVVTISMFFAGLTIGDTAVVVSLVAAGQLGFLMTGYLYVRRYRFPVQIALPERRDLLYAGGGAVGALVFATTAGAVLAWLGLSPQAVLGETVPKNLTNAVGFILLSTVLVAPAEEYLFRGVIQSRLRRTFSASTAILLASALFGSLHFGNYMGSLGAISGWVLLIVGVGVIMGAIYERTNNLVVPIAAHAAYNVVLFSVGYLVS